MSIAVMVVFLSVSSALILVQQRNLHREEHLEHRRYELDLLSTVTRERLLQHDYASVEQFLGQWAQKRASVVALRATTDNGFLLVDYRGAPTRAVEPLYMSYPVMHGGRELLTLEVDSDFSAETHIFLWLAGQLILMVTALTITMGLAVWYLLKRLTLGPMGNELTLRKELEQTLVERHDQLDRLVQARTLALSTANARLRTEVEERKQAEADLRRAHKQFHLLLDSAGEGIYGLDTQGRCTFINHSALRMLGYSTEELIGCDAHALLHHSRANGSAYPVAECPIHRVFERGKGCSIDRDVLWYKDGHSFPVQYSSFPIEDENRISGAVVVFRDITKSAAIEEELAYQATRDPLTGLLNRRAFERRLERVLGSAKTDQSEHVLLFLDLDQFKIVNDTAGHGAGDELLRAASGLLQEKVRLRDIVARLGGDEFGVLLEHCPMDHALRVARDLHDAILVSASYGEAPNSRSG